LQQRGIAAVVFRRRDEQRVVHLDQRLQFARAVGQSSFGFEIAVVDGQVEVGEIRLRDLCAGVTRALRGDIKQFLIQRLATRAAVETKNPDTHEDSRCIEDTRALSSFSLARARGTRFLPKAGSTSSAPGPSPSENARSSVGILASR